VDKQVTEGEAVVQFDRVGLAPRLLRWRGGQPARRRGHGVRPASGLTKNRRPWATAAVLALTGLVLFVVYYRLSMTAAVNSDGAANIFQAADLMHGSKVLHGWWLSDASFYTTELPQYVLIEVVLGQVPAVIHVASAMTYTVAVLLTAILAKGKATGRAGVVRMLIAAGIMLAPQVGNGVFVLDLSLGHIGTAVPLLVAWLVIDRAGSRRWVPPAIGILLAWVLVSDSVVYFAGVLPVAAVYGVRAYRAVTASSRVVASARFDTAMAASALAAVPVAVAASAVLRHLGGFSLYPPHPVTATSGALAANVAVTFESVLSLFGADFLGLTPGYALAAALLHLVGLVLAVWAVWLGIRRFLRGKGHGGPVDEILAVGIAANLFAFVFSTFPIDPTYAREIAIVLPFSAALAGRMLPQRLASARMLPALTAVLLAYAITLIVAVNQPRAGVANQPLANWLVHHHLRYGLAGYWEASSVTLASGQRVQVRPIDATSTGRVGAYPWEANAAWYNPALSDATFVVVEPGSSSYLEDGSVAMVSATFGKPAHTYRVGPYLVLVWHKNLLQGLGCGDVDGLATGTAFTKVPQCS
jgi:hypothetical protein